MRRHLGLRVELLGQEPVGTSTTRQNLRRAHRTFLNDVARDRLRLDRHDDCILGRRGREHEWRAEPNELMARGDGANGADDVGEVHGRDALGDVALDALDRLAEAASCERPPAGGRVDEIDDSEGGIVAAIDLGLGDDGQHDMPERAHQGRGRGEAVALAERLGDALGDSSAIRMQERDRDRRRRPLGADRLRSSPSTSSCRRQSSSRRG